MDDEIRLELLGELIDALQDAKRPGHNLMHLYVHFYTKRGREIGDLAVATALECLHCNIYHFEEFDLTDARKLKLQVH